MIEVAKVPTRWTLTTGDAEHIIRMLELHGHTNRDALLARNLRAQCDRSVRDQRRVWGNDAA